MAKYTVELRSVRWELKMEAEASGRMAAMTEACTMMALGEEDDRVIVKRLQGYGDRLKAIWRKTPAWGWIWHDGEAAWK